MRSGLISQGQFSRQGHAPHPADAHLRTAIRGGCREPVSAEAGSVSFIQGQPTDGPCFLSMCFPRLWRTVDQLSMQLLT